MIFLNRHKELERMKRALARKSAQFIVVFGRRRIGKSRLIREVLKDTNEYVYFLADERSASLQREAMAEAIEQAGYSGFGSANYPDWPSLFDSFYHRTTKTITLCIDDFPYLVKSESALPSILQNWIDKNVDRKINLILCGSAQHMMSDLVLNRNAPLYGRADEIIKLQPLSPFWMKTGLELEDTACIDEFSIWGGIPRYWELRSQYENIDEAIRQLVLDVNGILHEEPMRILLDEQRSAVQPYSILSLVAKGVSRVSEIGARLEKPASQMSRPMQFLQDIFLLEKELPFGTSKRNSRKSLYRIADPFLDFYYTFVLPNKSALEIGKETHILSKIREELPRHTGHWWEVLTRAAVPKLTFNGIELDEAARYWGTPSKNQDVELDIVAESLDGKSILIMEAKWQDKPERQMLVNKLKAYLPNLPFTKDKQIILGLACKQPQKASPFDIEIGPEEVIQALC